MSGTYQFVVAWPPSPMGITMFGMNPTSSSLITGIAHAAGWFGGDQIPTAVVAVEMQRVRLVVDFESQLVPSVWGVPWF
jgi:hypothetical protein